MEIFFPGPLPFLLCHYLAHLPLPISAGCTSLPLGTRLNFPASRPPPHANPSTRNAFPPSFYHSQSYCFCCSASKCCLLQEGSPPRSSCTSRQEHRYSGIGRDRSPACGGFGTSCLGQVTRVEHCSPLPRSTQKCPLGGDGMTKLSGDAQEGRPTRHHRCHSFTFFNTYF